MVLRRHRPYRCPHRRSSLELGGGPNSEYPDELELDPRIDLLGGQSKIGCIAGDAVQCGRAENAPKPTR